MTEAGFCIFWEGHQMRLTDRLGVKMCKFFGGDVSVVIEVQGAVG